MFCSTMQTVFIVIEYTPASVQILVKQVLQHPHLLFSQVSVLRNASYILHNASQHTISRHHHTRRPLQTILSERRSGAHSMRCLAKQEIKLIAEGEQQTTLTQQRVQDTRCATYKCILKDWRTYLSRQYFLSCYFLGYNKAMPTLFHLVSMLSGTSFLQSC